VCGGRHRTTMWTSVSLNGAGCSKLSTYGFDPHKPEGGGCTKLDFALGTDRQGVRLLPLPAATIRKGIGFCRVLLNAVNVECEGVDRRA